MIKKILFGLNLFAFITVFSQTGIGTETPEGALDITSPNKDLGLVLPQVDQAENTKNPTGKNVKKGTIVYDLKANCIKYFNGTEWSGCILAPNSIKLECSLAFLNQDISANYSVAAGTTVSVPYSHPGAAFTYEEITISSTNVTGLKAVLSSGSIKKGSGNLVFSISGAPSSIGQAKFYLNIGGEQCEFVINIKNYTDTKAPAITNLTCDLKDQLGFSSVKGKQIIGGKEVTVNYSGSSGPYGFTRIIDCNVAVIDHCIGISNAFVIVFSRPVTNVGISITSLFKGDEITFSTNNNQPVQLNNSSSCQGDIMITGNKIRATTTAKATGANITVGGVWFTELTIKWPSNPGAITFCLNNSNAL